MPPQKVQLLPLTLFASLIAATAAIADLWTNDFTFAQAQAAAACLHGYVDELVAQSSLGQESRAAEELAALRARPDHLMDSCRQNLNCRGCMTATMFHPKFAVCQRDCKDSVYCEQSCKRLRSTAQNRPGACPTATDPRAVACASDCDSDLDCVYSAGYKCCNIGLCSTCRQPTPPQWGANSRLPVSPRPKFRNVSSGVLLLTWWQSDNSSTAGGSNATEDPLLEPVAFVVQARYMVGREFEPSRASTWRNVSLVAQTKQVPVEEVRTGHLYQFRVAAVTRHGTRGFGPASAAYSSGPQPLKPGPPSSLSEGRLRIYSSGRISVQVNWLPPRVFDLPVHLYEIRWAKHHGLVNSDGSVLSVTRFSNSRPGNARSSLIENLEPGASYKIEVRAASKWGDEILLGQPNSIYVNTPQLESTDSAAAVGAGVDAAAAAVAAAAAAGAEAEDCAAAGGVSSPGSQQQLHILTPSFEDGHVTVRMLLLGVSVGGEETPYQVQWRRRVCIDTPGDGKLFKMSIVAQRGYFKLTGLQFNCRYWVQLVPLDVKRRQQQQQQQQQRNLTACFSTPSCPEIAVAPNTEPPECRYSMSSQLPAPPGNIKARLLGAAADGRLSYVVSWSPATPTSTPSATSTATNAFGGGVRPPPVRGFCVVWGPRRDEPVSQEAYGGEAAAAAGGLYPQMDSERAVTRVLGKDNTSLIISGLHRQTLYIVRVHSQAFVHGQLMVSQQRSYFFATEGLKKLGPTDEAAGQLPGGSAEIGKYVRIRSDSSGEFNSAATARVGRPAAAAAVLSAAAVALTWTLLTS